MNTIKIMFIMRLPILALMTFPFMKLHFNTFEYRITNEIIEVRKGLINKTKKFVPYRTITNVSTACGFFDRLFKIGNDHVETAGKSGTVLPEKRLMGPPNPEKYKK